VESKATGTVVLRERGMVKKFAWNGNPVDRERAKAAFDAFTQGGPFLAVAFDSETANKGSRVTSFTELETIERERGVVVAQVTRPLVGG